ncbi:MAG: DNA-deoxyinosine glycosylase, partial [Pseudomonadota bacterium]
GSLDASIDRDSVVCNDFAEFLANYSQIRKIAFNGKAAEQLFRKHALPGLAIAQEVSLVSLPSSSPAMASLSKEQKAAIWQEQLM